MSKNYELKDAVKFRAVTQFNYMLVEFLDYLERIKPTGDKDADEAFWEHWVERGGKLSRMTLDAEGSEFIRCLALSVLTAGAEVANGRFKKAGEKDGIRYYKYGVCTIGAKGSGDELVVQAVSKDRKMSLLINKDGLRMDEKQGGTDPSTFLQMSRLMQMLRDEWRTL